jgi:tRNA dimethylallyltransferase
MSADAGLPSARVLAIVGPTAAGKSAVGLEVALRAGGEIVSADSMQVYRGLDIGTAKPGPAELDLVPHHLINVADPLEHFSVAAYQQIARAAVEDISKRGRLPVVVGGTGLYVRALLHHYDFSAPGADPKARAALEQRAIAGGPALLHSELSRVDPPAAARIHPNDTLRLVRALEVWQATGRRISDSWRGFDDFVYDALLVGLRLAPVELYSRIDRRVEQMLKSGLVEEVRGLVGRGYSAALIAGQALGYKEIVAYLEGLISLPEAVNQVKLATRRYAKRQMTWFRREPGVTWLDASGMSTGSLADQVVALMAAKWG